MSEVIYPNKSAYSVGEIFTKLKGGKLWKKYAADNPKEAEMFESYVTLRTGQAGGTSPRVDAFKTDTGQAIYMALISAPSIPRDR